MLELQDIVKFLTDRGLLLLKPQAPHLQLWDTTDFLLYLLNIPLELLL
jgi:hypothetical protein